MNRAGQTVGQSRDAVPAESQPLPDDKQWRPRTDGKTAMLVSERSTVFDHKSPPPIEDEAPIVGALGPMPTEWTHDLVHCRLLAVDALCRQLPRVRVPPQYRSFLGNLQPQEASIGRQRGLSEEQEGLIDWTLAQIYTLGLVDRAVLMGMMSGHKPEQISAVTFGIARREAGCAGLKRPTVYKRYRQRTQALAEYWNRLGVTIDPATRKCWINIAQKKSPGA